MSTPTPQEMTLDAIRSVPLFASLDDEATGELRSLLRTREVATGYRAVSGRRRRRCDVSD